MSMTKSLVFVPGRVCNEDLFKDMREKLDPKMTSKTFDFSGKKTLHDMENHLSSLMDQQVVVAFSLGAYLSLSTMIHQKAAPAALILIAGFTQSLDDSQKKKALAELNLIHHV